MGRAQTVGQRPRDSGGPGVRGDDEHMSVPTWRMRQLQDIEHAAQATVIALADHDREWADRHVSKRPHVPEALRDAVDGLADALGND